MYLKELAKEFKKEDMEPEAVNRDNVNDVIAAAMKKKKS